MDFVLNTDADLQIQELVQNAYAKKIPLMIFGSNTKSFYGNPVEGHPLCVAGYSGIIDYQPSELVLTARAGTRLSEIETILSSENQMLTFDPPYFGTEATFGGTIACGLSGPRRPFAGAVRDSVLGVVCINGKGEKLTFGGQVMKNVAGYDVSRLMVGALGTLGVLLEISVKVVPKPEVEMTLMCEIKADEATRFMNTLAAKSLPLSASAFIDGIVYFRLSGSLAAVQVGAKVISEYSQGVCKQESNSDIWQQIREHTHPFFNTDLPLWRCSVAADSPALDLQGDWFIDWGGAQRWLKTTASTDQIREVVSAAGGHATFYKSKKSVDNINQNINNENNDVYHPLPPALARIHKNLKDAFDPHQILNRNKFYKDN